MLKTKNLSACLIYQPLFPLLPFSNKYTFLYRVIYQSDISFPKIGLAVTSIWAVTQVVCCYFTFITNCHFTYIPSLISNNVSATKSFLIIQTKRSTLSLQTYRALALPTTLLNCNYFCVWSSVRYFIGYKLTEGKDCLPEHYIFIHTTREKTSYASMVGRS